MTGNQMQKNGAARYLFIIPIMILILCLSLSACDTEAPVAIPADYERGQVTRGEDTYGTFYFYVPSQLNDGTGKLRAAWYGFP